MLSQEEIRGGLGTRFPFKSARSEQEAAFDHLTPWLERILIQGLKPIYFGGDAPTGIGKSVIAVTVARLMIDLINRYAEDYEIDPPTNFQGEALPFQVWVVTQNKLLQDQYDKDFKKFMYNFKGLANYACYQDVGKNCGESRCGRVKPPEGVAPRYPEHCTRKCAYDEAKAEAKYQPILLLNVAKALNLLKNPMQPPPTLMLFDEGHNVEAALDSEASVSISPEDLTRLGFVFEKYFKHLSDVDATMQGVAVLAEDALAEFKEEERKSSAIRDSKRLRKLEIIAQKTAQLVADHEEGIEYVTCSNDKLDLRPLQVHKIFRKVFRFPTVFLSATLLSKIGFEAMTGIVPQQLDWFAVDSPFPAENRKIHFHWRLGSQALNYGNQSREMSNVQERIKEILDKHANDKGIIHTHTYKNAETLYNALFSKYSKRLLFPKTAAEQKQCLEIHAASTNSVLISPSMTEGVDLKDDLCRFAIMVKVPYLPINDPVVEARMKANEEWYAYKTAMTIVQAPGRGVRSETDYADTYLVDPGFAGFFARSRKHFPEWFLKSIVKGYKSYY